MIIIIIIIIIIIRKSGVETEIRYAKKEKSKRIRKKTRTQRPVELTSTNLG